MKIKLYAISLLLSFLVVLSHQVISHHHHDTLAYDFNASLKKFDEHKHDHNNKHQHHQDSQEEDNSQKDTDTDHKHPFPIHKHISPTNEIDCVRTNQASYNSNLSIKIVTVLNLYHWGYSEPPNLTSYNFGEPPFLINSLFKPGAIALRGPPSIV
jgi:hypothetical protein